MGTGQVAGPPGSHAEHAASAPPRAGYFCLAAGVSLASGVQVSGLPSWVQLGSADALVKLAPALALVALITLVLHRVRWARAACPGLDSRARGCGRV